MNCPVCQTKYTNVTETRKLKAGYVRYRLCFNGHKFKTVEKVLE